MALRARCLGAAAVAFLVRVAPPFVQSPLRNAPVLRPRGTWRPHQRWAASQVEETSALTKFDDLPLSAEGKAAMRQSFGYELLTDVQRATFQPILDESNLLVRAKTGAGKTLSFLLPTMDRLHRSDSPAKPELAVLILSPVRELSMQIFAESTKLAEHYPKLTPLLMVGGSSWEEDLEALEGISSGFVVVVATPGRLQTHLEKTEGFRERLGKVKVLVLDEADQLAGELFGEVTGDILASLGPGSRQNLFYSATITEDVQQLIAEVAKEYTFQDMLAREDATVPDSIVQTYKVVPTEDMTTTFWRCVVSAKQHFKDVPPKIVAIFLTGRVAAFYAEAFRQSEVGLEVYEIHSRLKQQERTGQSDAFRAADSGILFTSDVTSRGLDYPGVTAVIQVGAPDGRDEYIHRVGRTGRASSEGLGVLLLHDFERDFLAQLEDLQISEASIEAAEAPDFSAMDVGTNVKAQAYYSRINHVLRHSDGLDVLEVFREGLRFAGSIGALDEEGRPPPLTEVNAQRYGVADVEDPSVNIQRAPPAPKVSLSCEMLATSELAITLPALIGRKAAEHTKVVAIFINGEVAKLYSETARLAGASYEVFEAHSGISKKVRKKVLQSFGAASAGVLFTAGVSPVTLPAEGVSAVLLVGLPSSQKDYGQIMDFMVRCGSSTAALLLASAFEEKAVGALASDLQLKAAAPAAEVPSLPDGLNEKLKAKAYYAWIRYYALHPLIEDKVEVIKEAKEFASSIGACEGGRPPAMTSRMLADMGLEGVEDEALHVVES